MLNPVNPKSKLPVAALLMLSLIYQAVPRPEMAGHLFRGWASEAGVRTKTFLTRRWHGF